MEETMIKELKMNYNYNLNRFYNGCNYITENPNTFDKYIKEIINIKEDLEVFLDEIKKYTKVSENEIIGGFKI